MDPSAASSALDWSRVTGGRSAPRRPGSHERLEPAAHELTVQRRVLLSFPLSVGFCRFYEVETYAYLHTFVLLKMCYFENTLLCFTVIFVIFRDFLIDDGFALLSLSIFFIVELTAYFQDR